VLFELAEDFPLRNSTLTSMTDVSWSLCGWTGKSAPPPDG